MSEAPADWLRPQGARWILARVAAVWLLLLGIVFVGVRTSGNDLQPADGALLLVLAFVALAIYVLAGRPVRRVGAARVAPPAPWRRRLWAASFWLTVLLVVSLGSLAFLGLGGSSELVVLYEASVEPIAEGPFVVVLPALEGPRVVELAAGEAQIMRVATARGEAWRVEAEGPILLRANVVREAGSMVDISTLLTMATSGADAGPWGAHWVYASTPVEVLVRVEWHQDCGSGGDRLAAITESNWHAYRLERESTGEPFCGMPWYVMLLMMFLVPVVGLLGPLIVLMALVLTGIEATRALRRRRRRRPHPSAGAGVEKT